MTEHRPLYHALVHTTEPTPYRPTAVDSLLQHWADGTTSHDTILLLPILSSSQCDESPDLCLQIVHLPDGNRSFCNVATEQQCACCSATVCEQHHARGYLSFQDETGTWHNTPNALLCETCAHLPNNLRSELYAFCRCLNTQHQSIIFPFHMKHAPYEDMP